MKSITSSFSFPSMITESGFLTETEDNLRIPKSSLSLSWSWGQKCSPLLQSSPQECIPLSPLEASGQDLNLGKGIPTCANVCTIVSFLLEFILFRKRRQKQKRERERDFYWNSIRFFFCMLRIWNHQDFIINIIKLYNKHQQNSMVFTCFHHVFAVVSKIPRSTTQI